MKIPTDAKIIEGELATFWLDEEGILCAMSKNTPRTLERQMENYRLVREITGNKKVCLLTDASSSNTQDKETRDYMVAELPAVFTAMAILSESAGGRMMTHLFMAITNAPIPMKLFPDEAEARSWLRHYL